MTPWSEPLVRDVVRFGGRRLAGALALIVLGGGLEGAGILLLVPMIGLAFETPAEPGSWPAVASLPPAALIGLFAALLAVRFAVLLRRDIVLDRLAQAFLLDLRLRAFRSLSARPWAELRRLEHEATGHALTRDVDRVEDGVFALVAALSALVMLAIHAALALWLSPVLTLFVLLAGAAGLRALRPWRRRSRACGRRLSEDDLALYSSTASFLAGLKPAKAHGLEAGYLARFAAAAEARRQVIARWLVLLAVPRLAVQTGAAALGALAVWGGLVLLDLPAERLVALVLVLARIQGPVIGLQGAVQTVLHSAAGYRVARELARGAGAPAPQGPAPGRLARAPAIRLEDVTVAGEGRAILDRVTVSIPAGRVTALTGPSGAGKTTLADVAVGLTEPDGGRVLIDGVPRDALLRARLSGSLAYVTQEPFMPARTLRETLLWGAAPADDRTLLQALDIVGARWLAGTLPGGLDGDMLAGAARLSGGERQRLRLARAWLRRPALIVLDEATAALDPDSERAVLGAFLAARNGATVLMITHRAATAALADRQVVLRAGRTAMADRPEAAPARTGA